MSKHPVLTILAAGMGSRYGGLKQMDPMDGFGNLIIDFDIYDALRAGFDGVVFIIKREMEEDFRAVIGDRIARHADVYYAHQQLDMLPEGFSVPGGRVKPWGTTHAVLCARDAIAGRPFAIINADDYYGPAAFAALHGFLTEDRGDNEHALVGYDVQNTITEHGSVTRGVCVADGHGYLANIAERFNVIKTPECAAYSLDGGETFVDIPKGTTVSMNCWAFNPGIMEGLAHTFAAELPAGIAANPMKFESLLPNSVQNVLAADKTASVKLLSTPDRWIGVTYKEDKPAVMAALQALKDKVVYKQSLWED